MIDRTSAGLLLALAAAFTAAGCARQAQGDVADQVRKGALGVVAAYNAQDAQRTAAYDAPDYVGIYHGSPNTVGPRGR
jgi:hypothetical protein